MIETALIPCPACGAVRHHPMTEGERTESRDACKEPVGGHRFEIVQIAVTCAACGHAWAMERHYSEPDTAAFINFDWHYPDGRIYYDYDPDEPADEPYA